MDLVKKPFDGNWLPPVHVNQTTSTDKEWVMGDQNPQGISPYAGNLYYSWTSFGGPVTGIVVSRSTNRNGSWSAPISVANGDVQGSVPGVAPDGTVYIVYGRGIFFGGVGTLEFVKSTNGGVSYGAPAVAQSISVIPYTLPNSWFRSPASLPAFAVSPANGNLYLAWADYRNGDADIYFSRSTDGGASWSAAVRLNDDPLGNGADQFQPQVSVAPNGRVAVMWFDRRLPCPSDLPWIPPNDRGRANFCIDTFVTCSFDDGQTWVPNIRASAQTWDWTLNLPLDNGGNGFIGDYQGIASSNTYDFPFWNATANLGENAENYQEVFVAQVPVQTVHVANIKMKYAVVRTNFKVLAAVPILDEAAARVAGATVAAEWTLPDGQTSTQTAVTNLRGVAKFKVKSPQTGTYTITVLDVQATGYAYNPAENFETSEHLQVP